jgi:outer membrane protein insertion porin family
MVIREIQVRYVNRQGEPVTGRTRPFIIQREFDLVPGDRYDVEVVQQGLAQVRELNAVRRANLSFEPTADPNQVILVVTVVERSRLPLRLSADAPAPSALPGPFQPRAVSAGANLDTGTSANISLEDRNLGGNDQDLSLRITGGENVLNGEVSFRDPWIAGDPNRTGYAINLFNQRAIQSVFTGGDRELDLPNGETPYVHRLGGGIEVFRPLASDLTVAAGLSYQRVSIRDGLFTDDIESTDAAGNALTFSDGGQDDLLILSFAAELDRRNGTDTPTSGDRVRLGVDQSIPVGGANIGFTRLSASYLNYLPLNLFGFAEGPRTLILSLQGGTILGEVPPYEAFDLDSGSIRGFTGNGIGTARSFVQATVQYQFPIANFELFDQSVNLNGAVFTDYVSDLGSGDTVFGEPAIARDKPGEGVGYGFGFNARAPIGSARIEFGWSDNGESEVVFSLGDRF